MPYGLIDQPDAWMLRWTALLYTRQRLREAYEKHREPNINGWKKLIAELRIIAPLSAVVAEAWFERIRKGEELYNPYNT